MFCLSPPEIIVRGRKINAGNCAPEEKNAGNYTESSHTQTQQQQPIALM